MPRPSRPLRAAIAGYGLAGADFHAPLIGSTPGLEVGAIVTSNPERASRASSEHPHATVVAGLDEALATGDLDLAVIATSNRVHAEQARAALDAGLAVVVDKPLTPTAAEARDLVERAARAGLPLTVFLNRRWDSDHLTVRRLIDAGELGDVHRYESRFERWRPDPKPGAWREETPPEEGGGLLLDLGPHLVDQALQLFGPASSVRGEIASRRGGADDDDFVAIEHASGVVSHLWMSVLAEEPGPRLRVLGDRAEFVVDGLDGQEAKLRAGARPSDGAEWGREPRESWGRLLRGKDSEPVEPESGDWPRFYAELERSLREGGPPPVDPLDAVAGLEVLEAARDSAASGETARPGRG